jgi:hypothetical protein
VTSTENSVGKISHLIGKFDVDSPYWEQAMMQLCVSNLQLPFKVISIVYQPMVFFFYSFAFFVTNR